MLNKVGCASSVVVVLALLLAITPAAARHQEEGQPQKKELERSSKEPFGNIPKGSLQIVVSIDQQKLHLYSDGTQIAETSIASGVPSLPTPLGVFSIIQKQVFHRSNIYSNAPMPFMQRITWSGVAIHEGENIGHPASHGCIRMPHDFAVRLYRLTKIGVPVVVARPELHPAPITDSHLFAHHDAPAPPPAPPVAAAPVPASDAAPVTDPNSPKPAEIGLRVSEQQVKAAASDPPLPPPDAQASLAPQNADVPLPPSAPAPLLKVTPSNRPIAIFISRKAKKIYVRQDFAPLFDAPVDIADPNKPFGTHLFTALDFAGNEHTNLDWNVISYPGQGPVRYVEEIRRGERHGRAGRRSEQRERVAVVPPPPETPAAALSRVQIPQDARELISRLMVPGSTLIISDQGLGDETGEGTNFIVVEK